MTRPAKGPRADTITTWEAVEAAIRTGRWDARLPALIVVMRARMASRAYLEGLRRRTHARTAEARRNGL